LREYIEKNSEQNAALVAARILSAVKLLESHPEVGRPVRLPGMRESWCPILLASFPTGYGAGGWN
jgi:hypothetical protein